MHLVPTDPDLLQLLAHTLQGAAAEGAVICLCAAWCGTCRDFMPLFQEVAAAHPRLVFRWVDIEDEADKLGELDIETFPTLVIGSRQGVVQFAGPVLPQRAPVERLLKNLGH